MRIKPAASVLDDCGVNAASGQCKTETTRAARRKEYSCFLRRRSGLRTRFRFLISGKESLAFLRNFPGISGSLRHWFAPSGGGQSVSRRLALFVNEWWKLAGASVKTSRPATLPSHFKRRHFSQCFLNPRPQVRSIPFAKCSPTGGCQSSLWIFRGGLLR